jgi:hypothetical protein
LAERSGDSKSALILGFSELGRHVLEKLQVEGEKKFKAMNLFESNFITNFYSQNNKPHVNLNHAERIVRGLVISKQFMKNKELDDNPCVKRFITAYKRNFETGKEQVFTSQEELQTFQNIFRKSFAKVLESKSKEFENGMSLYGGKLVLKLGKNLGKSGVKWVH